jgi:hypothetical protein
MIKNFLIENFFPFSKKFEMAVMVYSGAWGKLIHGFLKNRTGNFLKFDLDTSIGHENLKIFQRPSQKKYLFVNRQYL